MMLDKFLDRYRRATTVRTMDTDQFADSIQQSIGSEADIAKEQLGYLKSLDEARRDHERTGRG